MPTIRSTPVILLSPDHVAQDRRLAEDRRGAEPACGGGGVVIRSVALIAVLALSFLAMPLAAEAQQAAKIARIGFLETNRAASPHTPEAFRQGLRDLGYFEGRNVVIEYRDAEGKIERLPALAAELVALKVDVIVAAGTPAALATKQAIRTVPIVFAAVFDPVTSGLVTSLALPGGNVTGTSTLAPELVYGMVGPPNTDGGIARSRASVLRLSGLFEGLFI